MRKHILGFGIFNLIFASFALVYAFFYAPAIPPKETVKPPIAQTETQAEKPYFCNLRKNNLSFEVLSSQYFVNENKIISKIRVTFNGSIRVAPSKIYVATTYSSVGKNGFGENKVLEDPFVDSRELVVDVVSKVSGGKKIDIDENLYVWVSVTDYDGSRNYKKSGDFSDAKAVLFVYPN